MKHNKLPDRKIEGEELSESVLERDHFGVGLAINQIDVYVLFKPLPEAPSTCCLRKYFYHHRISRR